MKFPFKVLNKKKFILCYINAFIVNLCIYLMPVVLAIFTTQPFTLDKLKYLIISIIGLKLTEIILNHFWVVYILRFENIYAKDLQLAYFNRVSKMKPTKLNKVHNGFLKKQIDIISEESEQFMEYIFETVNGFSISIIIFLIEVINQDFNMFIVCLCMVIGMVLYNIWLGKKYVTVQERYNSKNEEVFKDVVPKLDKTNFFYSLRSNGINFFIYFMYAIILVNLYFKMKNGQDILSYLLFYATMFSGLSTELKDLSRLFMHYNKFQAATNQVEEIIGKEEDTTVIDNWNEIEIKNLDFRYNDESKNTISIPYFNLHKFQKVSIVGKSGQGKTTFLNILSRYIDIEDEKYIIDGKSQKGNLDLAYISQEIDLFDLSIRDNLCLGKNIDENILMKYLQEAGLGEWVEKLENGLDTLVGERGLKLSVGQKQRLNIVRGILLDKEIYILDEPTSNLDKETEKLIINLIQKYLKDKTVVIVTHRDEIRKICNKHYEFNNNKMTECELKVL